MLNSYTIPKIHMEPENHFFLRGLFLFHSAFFRFHLKLLRGKQAYDGSKMELLCNATIWSIRVQVQAGLRKVSECFACFKKPWSYMYWSNNSSTNGWDWWFKLVVYYSSNTLWKRSEYMSFLGIYLDNKAPTLTANCHQSSIGWILS